MTAHLGSTAGPFGTHVFWVIITISVQCGPYTIHGWTTLCISFVVLFWAYYARRRKNVVSPQQHCWFMDGSSVGKNERMTSTLLPGLLLPLLPATYATRVPHQFASVLPFPRGGGTRSTASTDFTLPLYPLAPRAATPRSHRSCYAATAPYAATLSFPLPLPLPCVVRDTLPHRTTPPLTPNLYGKATGHSDCLMWSLSILLFGLHTLPAPPGRR